MNYPDEQLAAIQLSLRDFVEIADTLASDGNMNPFVRFVLSGRLERDGKDHCIFLNARQAVQAPPVGQYTATGDIDSVIGASTDLPYKQSLGIFPMAPFRDTLKDNIHVRYSLPGGNAEAFGVPLHKIPNMALGTLDRRHVVVLAFPGMYEKGKRPLIPKDDFSILYESCIRPAALSVCPDDHSRWPLTYSAAHRLYHDKLGHLHFSTIDVKASSLIDFAAKLLEFLDRYPRFKNAFFIHQFKGLKGRYRHDLHGEDGRKVAMAEIFQNLLYEERLNPDHWFFDIAVEIRHPCHMLQWVTEEHWKILHYLLPSATDDQIRMVSVSKQQYHPDYTAQLKDIGGFRAAPGIRGKADKVVYINVYTTDKSATCQYHDGIYRRRKAWHLFPSQIDKLLLDMKQIYDTFASCGGRDGEALEGSARMEIRVSLSRADQVLKGLPHELLEGTLVSFSCKDLWYFKYHRMVALYQVAKGLQLSSPELRMRPEMLTTGAITAYMINALIYRPAEGRAEEDLLQVSCKHFLHESGPRPSMYDRGAYFLSDIRKKPDEHAHCLPSARTLENHHIIQLYRRSSMDDVIKEFHPVQSPEQRKKRKKRKLTSLMSAGSSYLTDDETSDNETSDNESSEWDSECEGFQSTERDAMGNISSNDNIAPKTAGRQVAEIVAQFPSCIMQLVPDPRATETPWVLLSPDTRKTADCNLFKSYQISEVFPHVQFKVMDEQEWYHTIFDRYFPEKGSYSKQRQHFSRAQYLIQWTKLMDASDHKAAKKLRQVVFEWFKELYWLPYPESDRMWSRRPATASGWCVLPTQSPNTGVRLAFNACYWEGRPSPNAGLRNTASDNEPGQVEDQCMLMEEVRDQTGNDMRGLSSATSAESQNKREAPAKQDVIWPPKKRKINNILRLHLPFP